LTPVKANVAEGNIDKTHHKNLLFPSFVSHFLSVLAAEEYSKSNNEFLTKLEVFDSLKTLFTKIQNLPLLFASPSWILT
jgi:hypothetical protein